MDGWVFLGWAGLIAVAVAYFYAGVVSGRLIERAARRRARADRIEWIEDRARLSVDLGHSTGMSTVEANEVIDHIWAAGNPRR